MPYEAPNPTKLRIKPTYNTGDYGHDVSFPLTLMQASNVQTLTPSGASLHQTTENSALPIDEVLSFIKPCFEKLTLKFNPVSSISN